MQTFFIPFYAVIVHTCVVILSSPHTHSLAQLLLLLCSVVLNKLHKIFLNTSLYSTTTTTTRRRRRRDIFVWGISEWKLENSTRLTRDFCRFSNGNLLSLRKSYCALMLQCRAHTWREAHTFYFVFWVSKQMEKFLICWVNLNKNFGLVWCYNDDKFPPKIIKITEDF